MAVFCQYGSSNKRLIRLGIHHDAFYDLSSQTKVDAEEADEQIDCLLHKVQLGFEIRCKSREGV